MLKSERIETKSAQELELMRRAGAVVAQALRATAAAAVAGASTADLDKIAAAEIRRRGAKPAFLGYRGYPAVLCASVNEELIHGIPRASRVLKDGDVVGLDLGAVVEGFYGDAALTVAVGKVGEKSRRLMATALEALEKGIAKARVGARVGDISAEIQRVCEAGGCSVVREYSGHGIGRALHESPDIPNHGRPGTGPRLLPGMTLAIETMVNAGGPEVRTLEDGWTVVTADGSLSAHFEYTVLVRDGEPQILTPWQDILC
ncbi:MAG TPA: type I methionyl aminopeptidase [Elusimicrobia bacterium]|nr:type I methionyl aminopeptidase [Elusimicrobiota bacterium]